MRLPWVTEPFTEICCGGLSVIGDIYKTEVFALSRYINRQEEIIPWNTITKPPSAELRPDQKDSDSLPPYEQLDEVLFQYIERRMGPNEIIEMGFDEKLVRRTLRLVNINEFQALPDATDDPGVGESLWYGKKDADCWEISELA